MITKERIEEITLDAIKRMESFRIHPSDAIRLKHKIADAIYNELNIK